MNLIKKRDITPNFFNTHFNISKKNLLVNIQNKINPNKIHLKDFHFIYDNEKLYVYGDYTKNKSNQYKIRQSNILQQQNNVNYYFKNMLYIENLIACKLNSRTISNSYLNSNTYPQFNLKLYKVDIIENDFFNVILNDLPDKSPNQLEIELTIELPKDELNVNIIDEYIIVQKQTNEPIINDYIKVEKPIKIEQNNQIDWYGIDLIYCCPKDKFKNYKKEYDLYQLLISIDIIHTNSFNLLEIERDIQSFKIYLIEEINKSNYDTKKKNKISKNIKDFIITDELLEFICNHFGINIIFNNDDIDTKLYISDINYCLLNCKYIFIVNSLACYTTSDNSIKFGNIQFKNAIKKFLFEKINSKTKLDILRYYTKILFKGICNEENEDFSKTIDMKNKKQYIDKCIEIINSLYR
jgi:hypothetical protein